MTLDVHPMQTPPGNGAEPHGPASTSSAEIEAAQAMVVRGIIGDERVFPSKRRAIERFVGSLQPSALQTVALEAADFGPEHWDVASDTVATRLMTEDGYPEKPGLSQNEMVRVFSVLRVAFAYKGLSGRPHGSIVRRLAFAELSDTITAFAVRDRVNGFGGIRGRYLVGALSLRGLSGDDVLFLHDHGHALHAHRETVFRDHRFDRSWAEGFIAVQAALRDGAL